MRETTILWAAALMLATGAANAQDATSPEAVDASAGGARAQTEAAETPASDFTISGNVALVSDYRFRGLSLSDKDPAIQGSIRVDHSTGFYIATWASSIEQVAGAETEIDIYGGWAGDINGFKPDIGVIGYIYPGGSDIDYYEVYGAVGYDIGPVTASVGINYAPDQDNLSEDNTYVFGSLAVGIPDTPLSLNARLGYEDGAFAPDEKLDWQIGASLAFEPLTLGVAYVDTDKDFRIADAGVVVSLTAAF